uniref:NADH-ubiquinone oxidoreductase chain 2 n=1 Tax=Virgulibracon endoxylaphagus TaxID=2933211 RepID=A0A8T9JGB9_9HYME|nr:NADH dehydrogenase subunit 2 [Virgulibracon endoxylaphagus]UOK09624.1 NADH dehydrogenase subunit 2 [Virgulibracon endoxylaphagus]
MIFLKKYNLFYFWLYLMTPIFMMYLNNYFSIWIFMELNLVLFITLLIINSKFLGDKIMKYYFINSLSSMVFLFFMNLMLINKNWNFILIMNLMILIKLGMFPFHLWFIDMMIYLNWTMCFFLMTWQKIIPLLLIMYMYNLKLIIMVSILGGLFSSMMIFNQIFLKKLLAYSSINHLSWMLISLILGSKIWLIYFFSYMIINYSITYIFKILEMNEFSSLYIYKMNYFKNFLFLLMLSLGGIPPLFGFLMKLIFSFEIMMLNNFFLLMLMFFYSLIFLFNYLNLNLNFFLMYSYNLNFKKMIFLKKLNFNFFNMMILLSTMNLFFMAFWIL